MDPGSRGRAATNRAKPGNPSSAAAAAAPMHAPVAVGSSKQRAFAAVSGFAGLRNQGATCYLSATTQTLFMIPVVRTAILSLQGASLPAATSEVVKLFALLESARLSPADAPEAVATEALTEALGWSPVTRQEDAAEFLDFLIDRLVKETIASPGHEWFGDLIESLFQGEQRYYTRCLGLECGAISYRHAPFRYLNLAVPLLDLSLTDAERTHPSGRADVLWSLQQLVTPELLRGENQYKCEACGKKTDAERGTQFLNLPTILTLQLQRFEVDKETGARRKVNTTLAFETSYDLHSLLSRCNEAPINSAPPHLVEEDADSDDPMPDAPPMPPPGAAAAIRNGATADDATARYDLISVLVHVGDSAESGHYIALSKDTEHNQWLRFDDGKVTPIEEADLKKVWGGGSSSSTAYMLVYKLQQQPLPSTVSTPSPQPAAVNTASSSSTTTATTAPSALLTSSLAVKEQGEEPDPNPMRSGDLPTMEWTLATGGSKVITTAPTPIEVSNQFSSLMNAFDTEEGLAVQRARRVAVRLTLIVWRQTRAVRISPGDRLHGPHASGSARYARGASLNDLTRLPMPTWRSCVPKRMRHTKRCTA